MPVTIDSATLTQTFPANALAHQLTVFVRADAAGLMKLNEVGQVRATASAVAGNSTYTSVVVDFGKPLTTGGAKVPAGVGFIRFVYKWRGDSFDTTTPVYSSPTTSGVAEASFPEVSSQRLQIELIGTVTQANAELVQVLLPSLPADLEVHVNDGPVAWRYPGPRGAPGVDGWESSANGTQKEVDLTAAIEPLLGDPDSATPVTVTVELRARTPGKLSVAGGTSDYDLLQKVPVTPDPDLDFEMEGDQSLLLNLPGGPATNLKEVWLTVAAAPPKERAVPAVGPDRVNEVELVLDSGRSACVRFPADVLADLTALRLPLHALDGSAEVRAQLLSPISVDPPPPPPAPPDEPGPPLEGASATQPVELEAPSTQRGFIPQLPQQVPDSWTLLPFDKPVPLKTPVWVSLQVTRGKVGWSLGNFSPPGDAYPVRRGSPSGPWLKLPGAVTALPGLGGRLHAIGHPPKASPLAPLQLEVRTGQVVASALVDVTPTAKGVALKIPVTTPVPSQQSFVRVISRVAMTVTVQSLIRVVDKT